MHKNNINFNSLKNIEINHTYGTHYWNVDRVIIFTRQILQKLNFHYGQNPSYKQPHIKFTVEWIFIQQEQYGTVEYRITTFFNNTIKKINFWLTCTRRKKSNLSISPVFFFVIKHARTKGFSILNTDFWTTQIFYT